MDNEAAVFEALRKLTYSEMLAFAGQLRDTAQCVGLDKSAAPDWAAVLQVAMDAYDDRDGPA